MRSRSFTTKPSALYIETVAKIRELVSAEGGADRAYAEATWDHAKATYLSSRGLKPTSGDINLTRLIGKPVRDRDGGLHNRVWDQGWMDHISLLMKDGKPKVFISQPYQLTLEDMRQLINTCDTYGLKAMVSTGPSWHFPSSVLTVEVRRKDDDSRW